MDSHSSRSEQTNTNDYISKFKQLKSEAMHMQHVIEIIRKTDELIKLNPHDAEQLCKNALIEVHQQVPSRTLQKSSSNIYSLWHTQDSEVISSLRKYFKKKTQEYLDKTTFTPWCLGLHSISGTIGKRRAKRLNHLLEYASADGVIFLADTLLNYTKAKNLNTAFRQDAAMMNKFNKLNTNPCSDKVRKVFTEFLNVINYPSEKFANSINQIIQIFSFKDIADPNSALMKMVITVAQSMQQEINRASMETLRTMR